MSKEQGGIPIDKLTKTFIKIRTKRAELVANFKEEEEILVQQMDKIKKALLAYCKEHGVESVKTSEGVFYRTTKARYWTNDWEQMHKFILEHQVPELLDKRLNQSNMKQFLEENPEVVPKGLNVDSEYVVSVRKKS
tara:strand:+ start:484 stop:891 length:408 start_codon:yes stop_codon:yes gene_type:complete